jgi:hypothetical protein
MKGGRVKHRLFPHRIAFVWTVASFLATACGPTIIDGSEEDVGTDDDAGDHARDDIAPLRVGDIHERTIEGPRGLGAGEVASIEVAETGATFIKLRFGALDLAPGDEIELAGADGRVVHRMTQSGAETWAPSIEGDVVIVTLRAGAVADRGGFLIDRVGTGFIDLDSDEQAPEQRSICGVNDKQRAACFEGDIADAARAVGRMLFTNTKGGMSVCTGSLISPDGHFLTNNHCVSSQAQVDGLEVRFNYQTTSCTSAAAAPVTTVQGGTLLATSSPLDYSLVLLADNPAPEFGWLDIAPIDVSVGTEIYIAQHPGGRRKEIAAQENGGACTVRAINRTVGKYASQANMGYTCDTEGGSSGSPVLLAGTHKLVALHHLGGCNNHGTYMRNIYPQIEQHLGAPPDPDPDPGQPGITALDTGSPASNLGGEQGSELVFSLEVPSGASDLQFAISGGSGDADLYVRYGAAPTVTDYDYRPYRSGNSETANASPATPGVWYVMLRGYRSYSGVQLVASYSGGSTSSALVSGRSVDGLAGAKDSEQMFRIDLPPGATNLVVNLSGGTGDADLYLRHLAVPTSGEWDYRPYRWGNEETVQVASPDSGSWYAMVRGYADFSGLSLTATWD